MKIYTWHSYSFTDIKPTLNSRIWFGWSKREIKNALHLNISKSSYCKKSVFRREATFRENFVRLSVYMSHYNLLAAHLPLPWALVRLIYLVSFNLHFQIYLLFKFWISIDCVWILNFYRLCSKAINHDGIEFRYK